MLAAARARHPSRRGRWPALLPDESRSGETGIMTREARKAVAYLRTSSKLAAIEAYAKAAGLEIVATFYDAAVSGADPVTDRPGFAEMLERLLSNGARTIVVAKRLGGAPIGAARCRNWLKVKNPDFRTIDFCAAAGLTPTLGVKLVHKVSRSGIVPIPVEHVHPGGMRRASHVYPTLEQRGLGASSVGLHFTNDVVQAVKKLHPVLHHRLVKSPLPQRAVQP